MSDSLLERIEEPEESAVDLRDPGLYINRELSWLDFNERVLELGEDERVPLLERLKFLAIYTSNLDEFFMVRVANVLEKIEARIDRRGPDGSSGHTVGVRSAS
jgi:polyphosphate kinase